MVKAPRTLVIKTLRAEGEKSSSISAARLNAIVKNARARTPIKVISTLCLEEAATGSGNIKFATHSRIQALRRISHA